MGSTGKRRWPNWVEERAQRDSDIHKIVSAVVERNAQPVRIDLADRAFHVDALGEAVDRHQEVGGGQKGGNHHTHRSSFRGFA